MTSSCPEIKCDLLIIGTGMAGMAAALFAARRGIDTVQVGMTGALNFASGLLDLLGVHPVARGQTWSNPWDGIAQLIKDQPHHPYAHIGLDTIRAGMEEFVGFLNDTELPYRCHPRQNAQVITPVGTLKTTYALPESMAWADHAIADRPACLLVDFPGLKGFSARQIKAVLQERWPDLHTVRLLFPGLDGELQAERMARRLETAAAREQLADSIRKHLGDARAVGLPAILGIARTRQVFTDIQKAIGRPVFEIPTMLPAITGLRLRECFERHLPRMGVRARYQQKILPAPRRSGHEFVAPVGGETPEVQVRTRTVILASGRFFGQGLHADRHAIRETIFNLPVHQPAERTQWHHKDLFHDEGHPIHRAGLAVDDNLRPTDEQGRCVYPNLFAAGSILAHQDWIRQKCGSGLAIASAYAAVRASQAVLGQASHANSA
ncbi:MAG: glycerol-3-phosphate dehydrogenase subunit GlpB [Desulfosarcina sp.]|nr:glycerol-3-phosphate dehydrogenase subunit GlpB [Desulfobacterales bacterium]